MARDKWLLASVSSEKMALGVVAFEGTVPLSPPFTCPRQSHTVLFSIYTNRLAPPSVLSRSEQFHRFLQSWGIFGGIFESH